MPDNTNPHLVPEIYLRYDLDLEGNDLRFSVYRIPITQDGRDRLVAKIDAIFAPHI
jgi:hypothetical protein